MVEIAREISQRAGDIRFELAGEGPERESILGSIREYGLEKIFFLSGFIDDIPKFYERLDLYMNTSCTRHTDERPRGHGTRDCRDRSEHGRAEGNHRRRPPGFLIEDVTQGNSRCLHETLGDRKLLKAMGAAARRKIERSFRSTRWRPGITKCTKPSDTLSIPRRKLRS